MKIFKKWKTVIFKFKPILLKDAKGKITEIKFSKNIRWREIK